MSVTCPLLVQGLGSTPARCQASVRESERLAQRWPQQDRQPGVAPPTRRHPISIFFFFPHHQPSRTYSFLPFSLRAFPGPAHPSSLPLFFLPSLCLLLPACCSVFGLRSCAACDFQEASFSVIVFCCRAGLVSQEGSCLTSALPATSICFARNFLGKREKKPSPQQLPRVTATCFSGVFLLLRTQIKLFETDLVRPG